MKKLYKFSNKFSTTKKAPKGICFAANFILARQFLNEGSISKVIPEKDQCIHMQGLYNQFGAGRFLSLFQMESVLLHEHTTEQFDDIRKILVKLKTHGFYLVGLRFKKIGHMFGYCFSKQKKYFFDSNEGLYLLENYSPFTDIVKHCKKYDDLCKIQVFKLIYQSKENSKKYGQVFEKQAEKKYMAARQRSKNSFSYSAEQWREKMYADKLNQYLDGGTKTIPKNVLRHENLEYHTRENVIFDQFNDY